MEKKKGFFDKIGAFLGKNKNNEKEKRLTIVSSQKIEMSKGPGYSQDWQDLQNGLEEDFRGLDSSAQKRKRVIRESLADKGGF